MQKHLKFLSGIVLAAGLSTSAFAQEASTADASTIVASVNGTDITLGHMIIALASLPEQYQQLPDQTLYDGILEQLVQQTVLAQSYTEEMPARVKLALENEERSLRAGEAIEKLLVGAVSEEDVGRGNGPLHARFHRYPAVPRGQHGVAGALPGGHCHAPG